MSLVPYHSCMCVEIRKIHVLMRDERRKEGRSKHVQSILRTYAISTM